MICFPKCDIYFYVSINKSCRMSKTRDLVRKSAALQNDHEDISERVSHLSVNVCH